MNPPPQHQIPPLEPGDEAARAALYTAIYRKDLPAAKALVQADPSITRFLDPSDPIWAWLEHTTYVSPLMISHTLLCKWLIDLGLDVNYGGYAGTTALSTACRVGGHEVVKVLLEHGASLTIAGNGGFTPLLVATTTISPLVMRVLLDFVVSAWGRKRRSGASGEKKEEEKEHEAERERRINLVLKHPG